MESDLPFFSISNEDLIDEVSSLPSQILPFSVYESVYFSNNDHADRFDMNVNPERLTLCEDVECKYYDVDNQLLRLTNLNYNLSMLSLNIRSVPKYHEGFFSDLVD